MTEKEQLREIELAAMVIATRARDGLMFCAYLGDDLARDTDRLHKLAVAFRKEWK